MHTTALELFCQVQFIEGWGAFWNISLGYDTRVGCKISRCLTSGSVFFGKFSNMFERKT